MVSPAHLTCKRLFRALDPHRNDYVPPLWEISRLPLTSAKQFYCIGDSKPSC